MVAADGSAAAANEAGCSAAPARGPRGPAAFALVGLAAAGILVARRRR